MACFSSYPCKILDGLSSPFNFSEFQFKRLSFYHFQELTMLHCYEMNQIFVQPVHEALDTKFLRLGKSTYSCANTKWRFVLLDLVFTGNTLVTAALPFMGDFINLIGSFTLLPLTFIFPSMIFLKVSSLSNGNTLYNPNI